MLSSFSSFLSSLPVPLFSSLSFFFLPLLSCSQRGGVAWVQSSGSLTLRDSIITNNTESNGELELSLSAFEIRSTALSLTIINPHPSSQTDVIRGDPFKLKTCTPTPPCKSSEACASASPSLGVLCSDVPFVKTVSCGDQSTADRHVQGCSTSGTLTITLYGFNLNNLTSVAVGAGACAVTSSNATSIICTVATASVWVSSKVSPFRSFWIFLLLFVKKF